MAPEAIQGRVVRAECQAAEMMGLTLPLTHWSCSHSHSSRHQLAATRETLASGSQLGVDTSRWRAACFMRSTWTQSLVRPDESCQHPACFVPGLGHSRVWGPASSLSQRGSPWTRFWGADPSRVPPGLPDSLGFPEDQRVGRGPQKSDSSPNLPSKSPSAVRSWTGTGTIPRWLSVGTKNYKQSTWMGSGGAQMSYATSACCSSSEKEGGTFSHTEGTGSLLRKRRRKCKIQLAVRTQCDLSFSNYPLSTGD